VNATIGRIVAPIGSTLPPAPAAMRNRQDDSTAVALERVCVALRRIRRHGAWY
jgi:hypothetical protein